MARRDTIDPSLDPSPRAVPVDQYARSPAPARRRGPRLWALRGRLTPYLFLSPFLVLFVFFLFVPLLYALGLSLFADRLVGGQVFVGLDNFRRAVHDPSFWSGAKRMLVFGAFQVPLMLGLALTFALVLDAGTVWLRRLFRLAFFLPYAVPSVVAVLMWGYLYGGTFGPFAQLADRFGFSAPGFLTPQWMLASVANVVTWEYTGYNMIIMYAALQAVPRELYEAAAIDGASGWQVARRVKIPLIAPALVLTTVFSIIGTLQLFNEPQVMSKVAPEVIGSDYTPNLYAYSLAFRNQQFNYAAASSEGPARIWDIYPRKGAVEVGSDADLTIVDLDKQEVVEEARLHGKNNLNPFEGHKTRGSPVATVIRGTIVMRDGELTAPPRGRLVSPGFKS